MKPLMLGDVELAPEHVYEVAIKKRPVKLSEKAIERIRKCNDYLVERVKTGEPIYGVSTGFGLLSNKKIATDELEQLQYNFLRSHSSGIGPMLDDNYVRAMLLLRAANLCHGHSGVSVATVSTLVEFLNKNVCPLIPEQGSVGASGDLAPLAHLALVLIGEGKARVDGKEMSGAEALKATGIEPIHLGPKEGLALTNGTQFMAGIGSLLLTEAEYLCDLADLTSSMTLETLRGTPAAFDELIHSVRPHPGQVHVAASLRKILTSEGQTEIADSHKDCDRVQDPYSLRCIPQVHGIVRDTLKFVRTILTREMNSVTDNPIIFPDQEKILNGGNFHGEYVAMVLDFLAIAVSELASISERRLEKMINPVFSDLPAFLVKNEGLNSGLMVVQYAAAGIVSENKTLAHPAVVDTIPTSADKEDHVSMGAWGAVKAKKILENSRRVIAMEILGGYQGIELLRPLKTSKRLEEFHSQIAKEVPPIEEDRIFHDDMRRIESMIIGREFEVAL